MAVYKRTPEKAAAFCAALAETANVGKSCKAVGIGRVMAYAWREEDPEFAAGWDRALSIGITALEDEAIRRAHEGIDEPVIYQGQVMVQLEQQYYKNGKPKYDRLTKEPVVRVLMDENGRPKHLTIKKYSDQMLQFLLRAHDPKYRDNGKSEVKLSGSLELQHLGNEEIDEEIERLKQELAGKAVSAQRNEQDTPSREQENSVDGGYDS